MKKSILLLITALCLSLWACKDGNDNLAPGLYVELEEIATFPGDSVWVEGQVSNYAGMNKITLSCPAWGVEKVINLKGDPKVFDYSWQMVVPDHATFPQNLQVKVEAINGISTVKEVPMKFLEDTVAPWFASDFPSQVSIDFDPDLGVGIWNIAVNVADDRNLATAKIDVPDIGFLEIMDISGRSAKIVRQVPIYTIGTYPATFLLTDAAGNETKLDIELVVMLAEDEDPFADYDQLYVVNAGLNPEDYVNGYYRYMDRKGEYQYASRFYAPEDGTKIFFVPTKSMDGDLFGTSPYVSSKLMNKAGYVKPIVIEKAGYYWLWADLAAHSYNITPYEPGDEAIICTEDVWVSGTGFDFGDWGAYADPMTRNGYRYEQNSYMYAGTGNQYYFYTAGWARVFRADADGNWWFESATGACCTFKSDYTGPVRFVFDTAAAWGEILKVNN